MKSFIHYFSLIYNKDTYGDPNGSQVLRLTAALAFLHVVYVNDTKGSTESLNRDTLTSSCITMGV